jgi:hypothetical protein
MRRRMITLRLSQLASQHAQDAGGLGLTRAFTPRKDALAAIPQLRQVWRARSTERLEQARWPRDSHIWRRRGRPGRGGGPRRGDPSDTAQSQKALGRGFEG